MTAIQILTASILLISATSFAGPGVSSGDDPRFNLTCAFSGVQDSTVSANFADIFGSHPVVSVLIPTGETTSVQVDGTCGRMQDTDQVLGCNLSDGKETYEVSLFSRGAGYYEAQVKIPRPSGWSTTVPCFRL